MTTAARIADGPIVPIRWDDGTLDIIDQRLLPGEERHLRLSRCEDVAAAIGALAIRGAPLLGIAAAYGLVLAARDGRLEQGAALLRAARPTAVNLPRTVDLCLDIALTNPAAAVEALLNQAQRLESAEARACDAIVRHGAALLAGARTIMTVCNTGALGTGHRGTALGIIVQLADEGPVTAICCETRPLLQGARLTTWELSRHGVPAQLIVDGAAAAILRTGDIDAVVVGCDRLAANGDLINKIGTYGVALAAAAHGVPFVAAVTMSSIDRSALSGDDIRIEMRAPDEVLNLVDGVAALPGVAALNPAFDVTPAHLVSAIVTEQGVIRRADDPRVRRLRAAARNAS
ncbi:S-methyl-5-thioribose-1-phosphate isomerase [Bradyrhizobium sp. 2TAF24]|uniref:S-methyl-5-thioribose-1-phosphate isomerase n=1 Tax=Bradyrhizobium sp. 2TAF24 TaxID=3233011 RepID=UPI003F9334E5